MPVSNYSPTGAVYAPTVLAVQRNGSRSDTSAVNVRVSSLEVDAEEMEKTIKNLLARLRSTNARVNAVTTKGHGNARDSEANVATASAQEALGGTASAAAASAAAGGGSGSSLKAKMAARRAEIAQHGEEEAAAKSISSIRSSSSSSSSSSSAAQVPTAGALSPLRAKVEAKKAELGFPSTAVLDTSAAAAAAAQARTSGGDVAASQVPPAAAAAAAAKLAALEKESAALYEEADFLLHRLSVLDARIEGNPAPKRKKRPTKQTPAAQTGKSSALVPASVPQKRLKALKPSKAVTTMAAATEKLEKATTVVVNNPKLSKEVAMQPPAPVQNYSPTGAMYSPTVLAHLRYMAQRPAAKANAGGGRGGGSRKGGNQQQQQRPPSADEKNQFAARWLAGLNMRASSALTKAKRSGGDATTLSRSNQKAQKKKKPLLPLPGTVAAAAATAPLPADSPWRAPLETNIRQLQALLMSAEDMQVREDVRKRLESEIRRNIEGAENVCVATFGSTVSGLAGNGSDVDMVLIVPQDAMSHAGTRKDPTPAEDPTWLPSKKKAATFLKKVMKKVLRKGGYGRNGRNGAPYTGCAPILSAKVPIVQFKDANSRLECDLCYGNTLAIDNSKLLKEYCSFDARFKELAWLVKNWAKYNGLNDNKSGTFSSYALTVLTIHYCQEQGVLPCLQLSNRPAEGAGYTYFETAEAFKAHTPWEPDKRTVLDLWVGWLSYFRALSFNETVISIAPPTMARKQGWAGATVITRGASKIVVEDPFDYRHNLTRGVADKGHAMFKGRLMEAEQALVTMLNDVSSGKKGDATWNVTAYGSLVKNLFSRPIEMYATGKKDAKQQNGQQNQNGRNNHAPRGLVIARGGKPLLTLPQQRARAAPTSVIVKGKLFRAVLVPKAKGGKTVHLQQQQPPKTGAGGSPLQTRKQQRGARKKDLRKSDFNAAAGGGGGGGGAKQGPKKMAAKVQAKAVAPQPLPTRQLQQPSPLKSKKTKMKLKQMHNVKQKEKQQTQTDVGTEQPSIQSRLGKQHPIVARLGTPNRTPPPRVASGRGGRGGAGGRGGGGRGGGSGIIADGPPPMGLLAQRGAHRGRGARGGRGGRGSSSSSGRGSGGGSGGGAAANATALAAAFASNNLTAGAGGTGVGSAAASSGRGGGGRGGGGGGRGGRGNRGGGGGRVTARGGRGSGRGRSA